MGPRTVDRDAAFAILSNRRRRQLLCLLLRRGGTLSLSTAAQEIVVRPDGVDPDDDVYRSVYVSLYQNHAPKLAAERIVHYDERQRTVRLVHGRHTRMVLRIAGVEPRNRRQRRWTVAGHAAVVAVALFGILALADTAWTLPWTAVVVAGLAAGTRQYVTRDRIPPIDDCDGLVTTDGSATGSVDEDSHPDQRQEGGHAEIQLNGEYPELADEDDTEGGGE